MGLGDAMASSEMTGAYWRAARTPLMEGWQTQSLDGKPVAPLMGTFRARNEWSAGTLRSTIFPNFWQHASDDHAVSTRITPVDATTSQVDVYWFVHEDAVEGRDYDLARLMQYSAKLCETIGAEVDQDVGWRNVGSLRLASSDARWEELKRAATAAKSYGFDLELVGPNEVKNRFPLVDLKDVRGATWIASDGYVD